MIKGCKVQSPESANPETENRSEVPRGWGEGASSRSDGNILEVGKS